MKRGLLVFFDTQHNQFVGIWTEPFRCVVWSFLRSMLPHFTIKTRVKHKADMRIRFRTPENPQKLNFSMISRLKAKLWTNGTHKWCSWNELPWKSGSDRKTDMRNRLSTSENFSLGVFQLDRTTGMMCFKRALRAGHYQNRYYAKGIEKYGQL